MDATLERVKAFAAERIAAAPYLEFRQVPSYPAYYVSDHGHVISTKRKKLRFQKLNINQGYQRANVGKGKLLVGKGVHCLILEAFVGPPASGNQCRHKDGVRHHCWLGNLEWGTPKDNAADRTRHGTQPIGVKNPRAKLTEEQVIEVLAGGESERKVAARLGVSKGLIWYIRKRKGWKHLHE